MELGKENIIVKDLKDNNKKSFLAGMKASFSGRKLRSGAYVTAMSVVVIVIILVVNMLITKMNLQVDLSTQNMFSISNDSKKLVKGLKDDVTIYYLAQSGTEQKTFTNIIKQYESSSNKIKIEYKDPVLYPKFAEKLGVEDQIHNNSFLIVNDSNKKAKYVDNSDLLVTETDPQTGEQKTTAIDVEGQITSAIQNVTTTKPNKMYIVEGHGEAETGNTFSELVKKMNVSTDTLKTLSVSSIPKDCDMLFINGPATDFTEAETKLVKDYLMKGGKAIITADYNAYSLKNFSSILDYYGIKMVNGVVLEGDAAKHINEYMNYVLPNIESNDITTYVKEKGVPVVLKNSSAFEITKQKRNTLKIEPLLTSSSSSYSKVDLSSNNINKEDGDIDGPFNLGLVSTDKFNGITSGIVVFGSSFTFSDELKEYSNLSLLSGSIGYCIGDKNLLSIPTKSLSSPSVQLSQGQIIAIGSTVVLIIPILILVIGGVVCYRRRRK